MKSFPFLITFSIVVSIVRCQQPSTVPGLIQSAGVNAPVNVLRIRQPTTVNERSSSQSQPIRRGSYFITHFIQSAGRGNS